MDRNVRADDYLNKPDKFKELESYGIDCTPVDWNGGFVATDKFGKDNLSKTEDSIQERFGLEETGE